MEKKPITSAVIPPYQGDSPLWAATKSFVFWSIGLDAALIAVESLFNKGRLSVIRTFHPLSVTLNALLGGAMAYDSYKEAKQLRLAYNKAMADNIAMRQTLNETSQILRHVEGEVKKGHLADSEFTMKEAAPVSHVARLEAEKAAQAVTDAAPQLR